MNTLGEDARNHGTAVGLLGDSITIRGGKPLIGRIELKGAKNLVTKAMVASLLGETPSVLKDVPNISDVRIVRGLLEVHGVNVVEGVEEGELIFDPSNVESAHFADIDAHAGSSRIPILFCGPLLHRLGEAFIPDLGGCRIGDRPIDYHLDVLRNFGAVVEKLPSGIRMSAPNGLKGAKLELPYPSVGATEQVLLTAVRAEGITELTVADIGPEITDLIHIIQKMGATPTARCSTATRQPVGRQRHSPPRATSSSAVRVRASCSRSSTSTARSAGSSRSTTTASVSGTRAPRSTPSSSRRMCTPAS